MHTAINIKISIDIGLLPFFNVANCWVLCIAAGNYLYVHDTMRFEVHYYMIPIIIAACIQFIKLIIDLIRSGKLHWDSILTAGWFPSVHSGLTSSIATLVFLVEGPNSLLFAVTLGFVVLISYDAMNVRYEAWRHAYYLNHIRVELKDVLWQKEDSSVRLKERIGHTPLEVIWGVICWVIFTILLYQALYIW